MPSSRRRSTATSTAERDTADVPDINAQVQERSRTPFYDELKNYV